MLLSSWQKTLDSQSTTVQIQWDDMTACNTHHCTGAAFSFDTVVPLLASAAVCQMSDASPELLSQVLPQTRLNLWEVRMSLVR